MNRKEKGKFERNYLAYIGAYDRQERGICSGKSVQELTNEDIENIWYIYCRDLETAEVILFGKDEIIKAVEIYGENLFFRKVGTFSPKQICSLAEVLEEAKIENENLINKEEYITEQINKTVKEFDGNIETKKQLIRR